MPEDVKEKEAAPVFGGADESNAADFKPLYEAPEIEVKTLEEDEIVCFKMRAKLFLFVKEDLYGGEIRKNYWKERGTGDVKLLRHKEAGKVRLLMRQEKTLKICANHLVSPFVELSPNVGSDRSWVFTASDFAEEELKTETFAIKFGNAEKANMFKDAVEKAKKVNSGDMKPEEFVEMVEEEDEEDKKQKEKEKEDKKVKKENTKATDELTKDFDKVKVNDEDNK